MTTTRVALVAFILGTLGPQTILGGLDSCSTNPSNTDNKNPVDMDDTMSLSCTSSDKITSCIFRHTDPISTAEEGINSDNKVICTGAVPHDNGKNCDADPRVTFRVSETSCAIDISNSEPTDTGKWYLTAVTETTNGQIVTNDKYWEVYTYNRSQLFMRDEDGNIENSIDTSYNWDTKEEEWVDGKSGYEDVEFVCQAYGGRPLPTFKWYINNEDNDDLTDWSNFDIDERSISSQYDYIENYESSIKFPVDERLIDILYNYGIDTNPSNGRFSFEITCEVEQGGRTTQGTNSLSMKINVDRNYDNGNLKGSMIGVIVGVVLAVILLIVALALLVFAKASNRWCFADEGYNNPSDARSHPNSRGGQGGMRRPANQVYRDNIDKGDDKKTVTRQSSTSSNNTSPKKASAPIQKNGDWLPDSRKSAYSATPTLAANTNLNQVPRTTSPASSSSSSSSASNNNNPAPPRPPKDGLTYANLDHKAFMQDPRNRVLPNASPIIPKSNTTYATVKTREVVQTSSRTFGEYKPRTQTSNLM